MEGCFYRLTDCHPLEEDGGMACLSSSRKYLAGVPGLTPRVKGDVGHFLPLVFLGRTYLHTVLLVCNTRLVPAVCLVESAIYVCIYVCMYVWSSHISREGSTE